METLIWVNEEKMPGWLRSVFKILIRETTFSKLIELVLSTFLTNHDILDRKFRSSWFGPPKNHKDSSNQM